MLTVVYQAWQFYAFETADLLPEGAVSPLITPGRALPSRPEVDVRAIVDRHLFGEPIEEPAAIPPATVPDAPDTTLSLRLAGTVEDARDNRLSVAIIADERGQRVYRVSDEIDATDGVKLYAVFGDRVILDRAGQLETLRLPENGEEAGSVRASAPRPVETPPLFSAAGTPPALTDSVPPAGPGRFANALRIDPHVAQGRMVGFRVNPGPDAAQFRSLGFLPGDVLTDINGTALNDPALGHRVFEGLADSPIANVMVIRDAEPQTLTIDINAL